MPGTHLKEIFSFQLLHKVAIIITATKLIHDYIDITKTEVLIKNPNFELLEPSHINITKVADVYHQLIDMSNFSFIVNPRACDEIEGGLLLLILIHSKPSQLDNRITIRKTWGQRDDSTRIVFLVGETDDERMSLTIKEEVTKYGDIVQGNFVDSYHNLTYKNVMGLKWVTHHCAKARYVLKVDDDVFVNINNLRSFLVKLSPWGAKDLIACEVLHNSIVHRETNGNKWFVPFDVYSLDTFPTFCAGWSVLYSQDVVQRLLTATQNLPYFWIDDVQVTGFAVQKIGLKHTSWKKLYLDDFRTLLLKVLGPHYAGSFLLGAPNLSIDDMLRLWTAIN